MWLSYLSWVWPSDCIPPEDGAAGRTDLETGNSLTVCAGQEWKTDQAMGADRAGSGWWAKPRVSRVRNWQLPVSANTGHRGPSKRKLPQRRCRLDNIRHPVKQESRPSGHQGPARGCCRPWERNLAIPQARPQGHRPKDKPHIDTPS